MNDDFDSRFSTISLVPDPNKSLLTPVWVTQRSGSEWKPTVYNKLACLSFKYEYEILLLSLL